MDTNVTDEQAPTPPQEAPATGVAPVSVPATDEQKLERLLRNLLKGLVGVVIVFAVVYFFGQRQNHVEQAPAIPDQAITSAESAVRAAPDDLEKRLALATAYAQGKRYDDALSQLKEILRVSPKFRPALLGTGQLLLEKGENAEAKSALDKYVNSASTGEFAGQDPQLELGYFLLGRANSALGNTKAAVTAFEKAVKIDPGDADAWNLLGGKYVELGRFGDAVSAFDRAIAFVPTGWCEPYEGMVNAYKGLNDADGTTYAGAMVRICNGGGLDSAAPLRDLMKTKYVVGALFGLGTAAEHDQDSAAAIDFYQQLLSVDRSNIAALSALNRLGASPSPKPIAGK